MIYLEVAVAAPLDSNLTYSAPEQCCDSNEAVTVHDHLIGRRVLVPLAARKVTGYIISVSTENTNPTLKIKSIIQLLDEEPLFHRDLIPFFRWLARYYHYPLGLVLKTALPGGLIRRSKRIIKLTSQADPVGALNKKEQLPWILDLQEKKQIGPLETNKILTTKANKTVLDKLIRAGLVEIETIVTKDVTRAKIELSYAPTENLMSMSVHEGDETAERIKTYRKYLQTIVNTPISLGEARTLYTMHEDVEINFEGFIPLKSLQAKAGTTAKVIKGLLNKGLITEQRKRIYRSPFGDELQYFPPPQNLSSQQQTVLQQILPAIKGQTYAPFLLHGITGCGKTEVYLQAAQATLDTGRDVLVLVPEIALASHLEGQFFSRFGDTVVLLHSSLSSPERFDQYHLALSGKAKIVIGARSAVFAPLRNPGLIVVDEEHDSGFKQDDGFHYHGRDVAVVRARHHGCVIILGSATPSITSYANAQSGKYTLLTMDERIGGGSLPKVTVVDLKKKQAEPGGIIQSALKERLQNNLLLGRQSILLLNRRGFATVLLCKDCGAPVQCSHCHVSLTYHKDKNRLICHYCGFNRTGGTLCTECRSTDLSPVGYGIERVEEEVKQLFPEAKIARLDSDTASDRRKFHGILSDMQKCRIDILIGTQIIAKGHHFPNVTLVGVVLADGGMSIPDFRAAEKTFQLLTQVTGRAGRGTEPGEVIIQTMRPEHYSIVYAEQHQYQMMYDHEIKLRKHPAFPPYVRLVSLKFQSRTEEKVRESARAAALLCREVARHQRYFIDVLGPAPAPLDKIKDKYRWQVLLKGADPEQLNMMCANLKNKENQVTKGDCELVIDVDPENMM